MNNKSHQSFYCIGWPFKLEIRPFFSCFCLWCLPIFKATRHNIPPARLCSALTWFHACKSWFCSYILHFQFKRSHFQQPSAPVLSRLQLRFQPLSWYAVIAHCRRSSLGYLAPTPTCPGASSESSEQLTLSVKARGRMDASCRSHACVGLEIWWLLCPVTLLSHNFEVESKNEHDHCISALKNSSPSSHNSCFSCTVWFLYLLLV